MPTLDDLINALNSGANITININNGSGQMFTGPIQSVRVRNDNRSIHHHELPEAQRDYRIAAKFRCGKCGDAGNNRADYRYIGYGLGFICRWCESKLNAAPTMIAEPVKRLDDDVIDGEYVSRPIDVDTDWIRTHSRR